MRTLYIPTKTGELKKTDVYTVGEFKALNIDFSKYMQPVNKRLLFNEPIAFDIETTAVDYPAPQGEHDRFTFMYIWQCVIAGYVIVGRYWDEWTELMLYIKEFSNASKTAPVYIYVHNLAYEFCFLKGRYPVERSFARENNHPITATLGGEYSGINFRCSYALSNSSLKHVAKDTTSCPFYKLEMDYTETRTSKTQLTDNDLAYSVVDPLIVYHYIKDIQTDIPIIRNIPITATGLVRREAYSTFGRAYSWQKDFLKNRLNIDTYAIYRAAFAGGDTHLAPNYFNETVAVKSYDLTSSYPSRWIEQFPASPPKIVTNATIETLNTLKKTGCLWIGDIVIADVELKNPWAFDCIPSSRCIVAHDKKCENGRIVSAKILRICNTCLDWQTIDENYNYKVLKVENLLYHEKKALLPKPFRDFVWKYYRNKTQLKGVAGKEREYMVHGKIPLNSIYGMTVTDIARPDLTYDPATLEWTEHESALDDLLLKYYGSRKSFMTYQVGVWVTAYSRRDLHKGLQACGADAVYWDTDSIKFVGDHQKDFDRLNAEKMERLKQFDADDVMPMNKNGVRVPIGLWDAEHNGETFLFRSFGSKKYVCQYPDGTESITVAGMNPVKALAYLNREGIGLFEELDIGTEIPPGDSGRTFSEIVNYPRIEYVNGERIEEKSYMNIFNASYSFRDVSNQILYSAWVKKAIRDRRNISWLSRKPD